ncbi:MAG: mannose-1-phosphate guanylyltransferase [Aureisphaera sp.]
MLGTGNTLLQQTFSRLTREIPSQNVQVLTNERYLDLCLEQLPEISEDQVVLEPAMRNTAPCILLSALKIYKENPDGIMIVAPSDHWIEDEQSFIKDIKTCFEACASSDILVTLGIHPSFPNTGYGYIESDKEDDALLKKVLQFREKPDYETAKRFIAEGNFFWNAGIFIWSVKSIIRAFQELMPEMYASFNEGFSVLNTTEEKRFVDENYPNVENISIDFAIMEKANNVLVKKATFDWNDLGTWGALHDKITEATTENAVVRATPYVKNSEGNMIYTATDKLVVIDGLNDYIVVDKEDVLLVFPKEKEQDIKQLLNEVKEKFGDRYS